jgi:quinol monooxygenase YgiN
MIRLNVFIKTSIETYQNVLNAAKKLTASSVKEDGCIAYDIFTSTTRDNVLLICETWQDAEALAAHEKTEHFQKLFNQINDVAALKIEKFQF